MWHFHVARPVGLWSSLFLFLRCRSAHRTGFPSVTWAQNVLSRMNNLRARLTGYTVCRDDKIGDILCNFSPTYHFSFSVYSLQQGVVKGKENQLVPWESKRKSPWHFKEVGSYTLSVMNNWDFLSVPSCNHLKSSHFFSCPLYSSAYPIVMAAIGDLLQLNDLLSPPFPLHCFPRGLVPYLANKLTQGDEEPILFPPVPFTLQGYMSFLSSAI